MPGKKRCKVKVEASKDRPIPKYTSLSDIKRINENAGNNKFRRHWKKVFIGSCAEVGKKIKKFHEPSSCTLVADRS